MSTLTAVCGLSSLLVPLDFISLLMFCMICFHLDIFPLMLLSSFPTENPSLHMLLSIVGLTSPVSLSHLQITTGSHIISRMILCLSWPWTITLSLPVLLLMMSLFFSVLSLMLRFSPWVLYQFCTQLFLVLIGLDTITPQLIGPGVSLHSHAVALILLIPFPSLAQDLITLGLPPFFIPAGFIFDVSWPRLQS